MPTNPLCSIGNYAVPEPSSYVSTISDVVDAGRNAEAVLIGDVVRSDVAKIEMGWNYISAENWAALCQKFTPSYGGQFRNQVTFFNTATNGWETRMMYPSDRRAGLWLRREDGSVRGYTGASLSLIEV